MITIQHPTIQHPYGHLLSYMAEHQLSAPALGIAWDGTSDGANRMIWGGEFLQVADQPTASTDHGTEHGTDHGTEHGTDHSFDRGTDHRFDRVAHFLPYYLPGGEACNLEPRRSALGLLYGCYGEAAFEMTDLPPMQSFSKPQLVVVRKILTEKINTPVTSSVGRLVDGIAALLNLHHYVSFEGQAALTLEFAATQSPVKHAYPFVLSPVAFGPFVRGKSQPSLIDWRPMVRAIVEDYRNAVMTPVIAAKFHNTLVAIIVAVAKRVGCPQVIMAGDCFQNTVLIERAIRQLSAEGFTPYWPQRMPPKESGLAGRKVLSTWRYLTHSD